MTKNKKTISRELMVKEGYKEYKPNHYQKKFADEKGTKFFINVTNHLFDLPNITSWWQFSIQFNTPNGSVELRTVQWFNEDGIHSKNNILHAEDYLEKMWMANDKPYYEKHKECD